MEEEVLALEELNDANNNLKLFTKNYNRIQKEYANKFVAIKDGEVVICESKLEPLIKKLKEQKKDPANFLIDYIYGKGESLVGTF